LTVSAVLFLAAYSVAILDPGLPADLLLACKVVAWTTWVMFVVDFVVRIALAQDRRRYVVRHLLDVLVIALPLLRPLRLLRLVPLLAVLNRRATTSLRGRLAVYVAGGAVLLAYCGALTVLEAERANPEANITNFGDAIWWAATTMTTVGYGDRYPTTGVGRLAAVALMVGGIAVLGVVTASVASWLVEQVKVAEQEQTDELQASIRELQDRVDSLTVKDDAASRTADSGR
jgi:voltage-gated potassium channel